MIGSHRFPKATKTPSCKKNTSRFSIGSYLKFFTAISLSHLSTVYGYDITLTWNDNSDNEIGFIVERKVEGGSSFSELATVDANVSTYVDSEINETDTFEYRVKAFNNSSSSGYTNIASATLAPQNNVPSLSTIDNQSLIEGESITPISFTISDTETSASLLNVTGSSSNQSLIADENIVILGTGSERSILLNTIVDSTGTSTITVEVSDGEKSTSETFLFSVSAPFSTSDLFLGMAFDEESGSAILDSSVNKNNGSLTEGVLRNDSGRFSQALDFSGSGGQVDIGNMDIPGSALTISAWIKPDSFNTSDARIISKATTTTDKNHIWMLSTIGSNGSKARMRLRTTNGDTTTLVGSINLAIGEWQHIAGTYDGSKMRIYVNGTLAGAIAKTGDIFQDSTVPASIGDQPQGNRSFDGLIDEVRIYTAALSETEISEIMSSPLTETQLNDAPTLTTSSNITITDGDTIAPIAFSISDNETSASALSVSASSSNNTLLSNDNILIEGTSTNRTIVLTPQTGITGTTTITVTASDGEESTSTSFILTVTPAPIPNTAPTISPIEDTTITDGDTITPIAFSISDNETSASALSVSASSSNNTLLSNDNISIEGTSTNRTIVLTPQTGITGTTTITVTASDGKESTSTSFILTVTPAPIPNTAPTISDFENNSSYEGSSIGPIQFTIGDSESLPSELSIQVETSNNSLFPEGSITVSLVDNEYFLTLQPTDNVVSTSTITVRVSDESMTTSSTFTVETKSGIPTIIKAPMDIVETEGNLVALFVEANGRPELNYQWFLNDTAIPNANNSNYVLAEASSSDSGRYSVIISNNDGRIQSSESLLTINKLIPIEQTTVVQEVGSNGEVILSLSETSENLIYQWYFGETGDTSNPIESATSSSYTPEPGNSDTSYWVKVSIEGGSTQNVEIVNSNTISIEGIPSDRYYFGEFDSDRGSFGILVRADNTAVFLAEITSPKTIIATVDMEIGSDGDFHYKSSELGWIDGQITGDSVSGKVSKRNISFAGTLSVSDGSTNSLAGFYDAPIANTSDGQIYLLAGPNETSYIISGSGDTFSGMEATLSEDGILSSISSEDTQLSISLNNTKGTLSGTTSIDGTEFNVLGLHEEALPENHLVNTSVRAQVKDGAGVMIAGFVIQGEGEKEVLIRGVGPSLTKLNVNNPIEDTTITLYKMGETAPIAENDDWGDSDNSIQISNSSELVGAFPLESSSKDSALLLSLSEGVYTAIVTNNASSEGTALVEVYDVDEANDINNGMELVNISLRGEVGSGEKVIIGGFVVQGDSPKRLLIRAMGSELSNLDVPKTLNNPELSIYRTTDTGTELINSNDSWDSSDPELLREAATITGAFPFEEGSGSAAKVIWLEPGVYTAMASSADSQSGIALIEVYQLP